MAQGSLPTWRKHRLDISSPGMSGPGLFRFDAIRYCRKKKEKEKKGSYIFVDEFHMSTKLRAFSHTACSYQILTICHLSRLLFRAREDSHSCFFLRLHSFHHVLHVPKDTVSNLGRHLGSAGWPPFLCLGMPARAALSPSVRLYSACEKPPQPLVTSVWSPQSHSDEWFLVLSPSYFCWKGLR